MDKKSTKQKFNASKYKIDRNIPIKILPPPLSERKQWLLDLKPKESFVFENWEYSAFTNAARELVKVHNEKYFFTVVREDEDHYRFHRLKEEQPEQPKEPAGE